MWPGGGSIVKATIHGPVKTGIYTFYVSQKDGRPREAILADLLCSQDITLLFKEYVDGLIR